MKNKNKDFKVKKWEFVFPDETPLGICSEFAEVFINSTMERDPNFAGIIVGYPVSLYGEICDDERFGDGRTMILTSHIKSIDRKLPVLSYEFGLDWYELWRDVPDDPIWTEMSGFYI